MKRIVRRVTERASRALLQHLEERAEAQHHHLVSKLERLEKRLDSALAKGQAEARLLVARIEAAPTSPRKRRLGARVPRGFPRAGPGGSRFC